MAISRHSPSYPHSRIRLRRRVSPFVVVLPTARWISTVVLVGALLVAGYRFVTRPFTVGALEFTSHIVGIETGAVGVLGMAAADLDDDGDIDIVTAGTDGVKVYDQTSSGTFEQKIIEDVDGERVQIIDLDADRAQDLLVTLKGADPSVRWYRNSGNLEFSGTNIGSGTDGKAYAGDIDGDGAPDIVTATTQGGLVVLNRWMNNGTGTFSSTTLSSDSGVTAVTVGDIDGDGYNDIVTGGSNGLQSWDTSDGYSWSQVDVDTSNNNRTHIVVADVTGNGKNDIVTGDQTSDLVAVYRHVEYSTFDRIALTGDTDAVTVQPIDLDEDGDTDVVAAAQDDNSVFWYDNDGSEEFTRRTLASDIQSVFGLQVIDVDDDNDFDFVTGDNVRGTVFWYERTRAKPAATTADNIQQTTDGAGRILFDTTISDGDLDPTRIRVLYSTDGEHWYKPWLLEVRPARGTVDLKNSNGYQVGTSNAIDTDDFESVKLTLVWDTKSSYNTGGPIVGDVNTVQLKIIPRDSVGTGVAVVSSKFRVDNKAPTGFGPLIMSSISDTQASLSWNVPTDSASYSFQLYYGTDRVAVLERTSPVWDAEDDAAMGDIEATSTTVTDLVPDTTYTFKLYVTDAFGNTGAAPSVRGTTTTAASIPTTPSPAATPPPFPEEGTPAPFPTETLLPPPFVTPTPTPLPEPTQEAEPPVEVLPPPPPPAATPPSTLFGNLAPQADAGPDQVVNPTALVILDGTASSDPEGDSLTFSWQQLTGPEVDLVSERTATPSFSAGEENETYIFTLTVRDSRGASGTDTVTVATRALPVATTVPVATPQVTPEVVQELVEEEPSAMASTVRYVDLTLFALALLSSTISVTERLTRAWRDRASKGRKPAFVDTSSDTPRGIVLHYRTGRPISQAQVMVYDVDGKLKRTERTNARGEFPTLFPVGKYTISVNAEGFTFAPADANTIQPAGGIVYTGGKLAVNDGSKPIHIVVPMKPIGEEVSSFKTRTLHMWQAIQQYGRILSWPIFVIGALLNTVLVFWTPSSLYLVIEVLYVVLVIGKVVLEVRVRPAYGLVRDAITHVPVDLAVVRLFEAGTNRLIMTRVTNAQGRFFALPPPGTYTVTITKLGYAVFSREDVKITAEQDSILQITADLMPVAPQTGALAQARGATL